MESVILPCKPISLTVFELPSKAQKRTISFNNVHQPVSTKPDPRMTDAHLNYLCRKQRINEAINVLDSIAQCGFKVRPKTFTRLIQSCIDSNSIHLGRELHQHIHLLEAVNPFIETKLVSMYGKCGSLEDAYQVFDKMRERNLYTWSAMIGAYSRERKWRKVVELFCSMMEDGTVPDYFLFSKILQACGNCGDIETGKLIHSILVKCGINCEIRVDNSILALYAKCGKLSSVKRFFENMGKRDRVSWNSVILGYCQKGEIAEAWRLFELMREEGIEPGLVTWNTLISSYNQLGRCDVAMERVKEMERFGLTPDVFTWTSMISGFALNSRRFQALELFRQMILAGVQPNAVTLTSSISACSSLQAIRKGKELHSVAIKIGFGEDVLVGNSLIDMYSKCGELEAARLVFDMILEKDAYTWNTMIGGYWQAGYCGRAHDVFMKMRESDVPPNVITWNVMISGYIQNGDEEQAMDLFQRMEKDGIIKRNTASWNALIAGYLQNGHKNKALWIFRQMQSFSIKPNSITILSILPACANLVAAKKVKEIHGCVLRRNLESELPVANSLIDTYAKSGNIVYSKALFDGISTKDIITWNTLITGAVLHGCCHDALELFDQMRKEGFTPNRGTFVSIISAYGIAKLVDEGKQVFSSMTEDYRILPGLEHYLAMINLFCRSGRLEEAIKYIEDMEIEPDSSVWAAFLTACRIHGNVRLAVQAGERLLELEPGNALVQLLLLQAYAICGIAEDSVKVKKPGKWIDTKEALGLSWMEVENTVHTFVAGDQCQKNIEGLYSWIKSIKRKNKSSDHYVGLCIEEEEKEEISGVHSEKLALGFALVDSSKASQCIRIVKNLRMCGDCHRTAKFVSKTHGCEIYLSDSKCLHHFKDGGCSCGDYW
ncbi:unnamed protein product [Ilex paraguariensis]|uniref:DYW domain-containing protein n=1 Tax=Ilex paraguariensis TaxID=185542 RepID=A0ABC8UAR8_9AQUA